MIKSKKRYLGCFFAVLQIAIVIICFVGWVKCIYKLTQCDFKPSYKAEVIYTIGTCTGLGVFIGYIDFGK